MLEAKKNGSVASEDDLLDAVCTDFGSEDELRNRVINMLRTHKYERILPSRENCVISGNKKSLCDYCVKPKICERHDLGTIIRVNNYQIHAGCQEKFNDFFDCDMTMES